MYSWLLLVMEKRLSFTCMCIVVVVVVTVVSFCFSLLVVMPLSFSPFLVLDYLNESSLKSSKSLYHCCRDVQMSIDPKIPYLTIRRYTLILVGGFAFSCSLQYEREYKYLQQQQFLSNTVLEWWRNEKELSYFVW